MTRLLDSRAAFWLGIGGMSLGCPAMACWYVFHMTGGLSWPL